jgi:von Willebrand factor type A domain
MYEAEIFLHTADMEMGGDLFPRQYNFGIISVKTVQKQATTKPLAVFFSVDDSGSMSDSCKDGRTKMQHIKHTLSRILQIFAEREECSISVAVESFDTTVKPLFDFVKIGPENIDELLAKVNTLTPCEMTNIEEALASAKTKMDLYRTANPETRIVHIQLTDGMATAGATDPTVLQTMVSKEDTNIFVGFGLNHDSILLQTLASGSELAEYRVVDKLENAGLVYGEIIHHLLYPAITGAVLRVEETDTTELYDYKTNTWGKELRLPVLAGVSEKTFHFRTTENTPTILFQGVLVEKDAAFSEELDVLPDLMSVIDGVRFPHTTDLTKYMFRQRTQELLYECKEYNNQLHKDDNYLYRDFRDNHFLDERGAVEEEQHVLKEKVKAFYKEIKEYMKSNDLKYDVFMRELLDDLYIVYQYLGKDAAIVSARQVSQGREDSYRVTTQDKWESTGDVEPIFQEHCLLDNMENTSTEEGLSAIMRACST